MTRKGSLTYSLEKKEQVLSGLVSYLICVESDMRCHCARLPMRCIERSVPLVAVQTSLGRLVGKNGFVAFECQ
jgi:ribosomal protein L7Ae-like RNA K-turn-binding protein